MQPRSYSSLLPSVLVLLAAIMVLSGCSGNDKRDASEAAEKLVRVFEYGIGRDTIYAQPGAQLSMTVAVPDGVNAEEISWSVKEISFLEKYETTDSVSEQTLSAAASEKTSGPDIALETPDDGTATIEIDYPDGETVEITVEPTEPDTLVGWDLKTKGKVFVNDGLPVAGEALITGSTLDTREGEATYQVRAGNKANGGKVTYGGVLFRTGIEMIDGQPISVAAVRRRAEDPEQTMTVSVEHVSNVKYTGVRTPDAVAMVKGTDFSIAVTHTQTKVDVRDGAVRLSAVDDPGQEIATGASGVIEAQESARLTDEAIAAAAADPDGWEEDEEPLLAKRYGYETWDDPDDYGFEPEDEPVDEFEGGESDARPGLPLTPFTDENGDGIDDFVQERGFTYGWAGDGGFPLEGPNSPDDGAAGDEEFDDNPDPLEPEDDDDGEFSTSPWCEPGIDAPDDPHCEWR